ncbi:MAG: class I SAM-dependent methyltransferase [Woeseia sp.]
MSTVNLCLASGDKRCDFAGNYELSRLPAVRALERDVLGCDYGGTSWTTREQTEHIAKSLELQPGVQLLEVGSGSGWPGLLLGSTTGCELTLLDIPTNALKQAAERAAEDRISDQVRVVAGSGTALPFSSGTFDRISHSDVLCCLPAKLKMLQECRRVARPDARMHMSVILPAPKISSPEYQEVLDGGPPFVDAPDGYEPALKQSRWQILEHIDVSAEYRQSLETLVGGMKANTGALQEAFGANELASEQQRRENQIVLIERGLMRREVFVVRAN